MKNWLVLFAVLLSLPVWARDYYVNTNGSDNNNVPGTAQFPWRTINHAILKASAGDTVHVAAGQTFAESVYFGNGGGASGTPGNPLTLMCDDPVRRATISESAATQNGVLIYNADWITLCNLAVVGPGADVSSEAGVTAQSYYGGQLGGITISNVSVSGFYDGIVITAYGAASDGFSNVLIQSCQASNNLNSGAHTYALVQGGISNIVVRNCIFNNNPGDPAVPSNPSGNGFALAEAVDGLIDHCVAHDNGGAGTASAGPVGLWCYDSKRVTIQYCESYRNQAQQQDGDGFDLDLNTTDSLIQYCYSHDNAGSGFLLYSEGMSGQWWSNNTVRYCVSENDDVSNKMGALLFFSPSSTAAIMDSEIYGNTIYSRYGPAVAFNVVGMSGVALRNNLFVVTNGNYLISGLPSPTPSQADFQGNDYWSSGGAFKVQAGQSSSYSSLNQWRSVTGQEKLSGANVGLNVDPKLAAPGSGGTVGNAWLLTNLTAYQLLPGSPLAHAGLNLSAAFGLDPGTNDFFGTAVPTSAGYAIGAAEFIPWPTTLALTNPSNPSIYGGSVTFTATLQTNGDTATGATGNFAFMVDALPVVTNVVVGGTTTFTTGGFTSGTHTVTVQYSGDPNFASSANSVTQTVNPQTPTLTAPTASAINSGQALSASTLSGGSATNAANSAPVPGGFAFTDSALVPDVGVSNVSVTFTPQDAANYTTATTTVNVQVNSTQAIGSVNGVLLPSGAFQISFSGTAGLPFRVVGTNLLTAPVANWPTLMSGTFGTGGPTATNFADHNDATQNQWFYRIISP